MALVPISVVMTLLNEAATVPRLFEALVAQTCPPDEVVVADGGSTDGTLERVLAYAGRLPVRVVAAPGANIAAGRNAAIAAATGDLIAATDGGGWPEPDWLARLAAPFARPDVMAVAGFFRSDPRTVLEVAMGAAVLPEARDVNPATFLPSSRSVAFRRSVWAEVGGYPEWLDFSEDVVFDLAVRARFGPFVFVPDAVVNFRPRGSLRALARQYYQYARGDGKAGLLPRIHAIRYFTYLVLAPLLVYTALAVNPWVWLAGLVAGLAYLRLPLRRLWPQLGLLPPLARLQALAWLPIIRLVGDVAKMLGYPVGVAWRWQRRRAGRPTRLPS